MPILLPKSVGIHDIQGRFAASNALYRAFCGGIGSGKTWVGAYDLITRAKNGRTYMIGSPTAMMMADTVLPTFREIAQELGFWDTARVRLTPYPPVRLTTGGT